LGHPKSKTIEDHKLHSALESIGLPVALDYQIEERGRNLSLGERQLICLARCLLQDAPIVIMDEATSSIDPQSEELLVQATRKSFFNRTQLIIAHRLSTVEHCDRVLWLENGQIKLLGKTSMVLKAFRSQIKDRQHSDSAGSRTFN
jgi:ABC-type multidrug transport system fused ATPase/permease subunit